MRSDSLTALARHQRDFARAGAAAIQQQYQEVVDICSELLTSGIYEELATQDPEAARRARAETRLLLGTAMHYNEAHYEDVVRVLKAALDSPLDVQKDAQFTLAIVHLSFENAGEAASAMRRALELIDELKRSGSDDPRLTEQEREAEEFFQHIAEAGGGAVQ
jgi:hypothetical protein